jgi:hypothetical protein
VVRVSKDNATAVEAARLRIRKHLPPEQIHTGTFRVLAYHLRYWPPQQSIRDVKQLAVQGDDSARVALKEIVQHALGSVADPLDLPDDLYWAAYDLPMLPPPRIKHQVEHWPRDRWIIGAMNICIEEGLRRCRTYEKRVNSPVKSGSQVLQEMLKSVGIELSLPTIERISYGRPARNVPKDLGVKRVHKLPSV